MLDRFFEEEDARVAEIKSIAVGIDLGTTNSVVAHSSQEGLAVFEDEKGRSLHPSVIAFLPRGGTQVGHDARLRRLSDPENTVYSIKRVIGQPFSSPRLQQVIAGLPYRVVEGKDQEPMVETRGGSFTVSQISSRVVEYVKHIAANASGQDVTHCVITVPANFNDAQREATRRAAKAAGLEVLRILNEPTAAALAYGHGKELNKRIAVFDMGGGTFDLSVLAVRSGLYQVLATGGDPFLGGDDMDQALANELAKRFLAEHRLDPRTNAHSLAKLMMAAEEVKIQLSESDEAAVHVADLDRGLDGTPLDLETVITRAEFEAMILPYVDRALAYAESVLLEADISPQHVDDVLLVGGATNVPLVRRRVEALFGRAAQGDIDPMQVVALGAAAHAQALFAPETMGRVSAAKPSASGATSELSASTEDYEDYEAAQTHEMEAMPVALLLDVVSHPVGLGTTGGYAEVLLEKNTPIPAEVSRFFSTARDDQDCVILKVCQGNDPRFENNEGLGELKLEGLRPGPRGKVRIEVGFMVDADGLLQVSARDPDTGTETSAVLSLFGLGSEDLFKLDV